GKVYVGTNGGTIRCLNSATGGEIWRVNLPSDVVSSPAVADGRVIFGCGDSKVYCLNASTGAILWTKTCTGPMYSSPTIDGNAVYIGTIGNGSSGSRYLYSLNTATGAENWKFSAANAIETKPCVLGNTVFFGDWGSYFYAVYTSNGTQRWSYQRNSNRYYSPADSWPVASSSANRVFVADREYYLNAINITTGTADWTRTSVSSQGITPDGSALLVRLTSGNLEKTTFNNSIIWSRNCSLDSAPVSPLCNGNRAAVVDQDGLVSVVNLTTGVIEYQFQVACGYQLSPVNIDSAGNIYAATYDGYLICATNLDYSGVDWENFK
ncbi:MAG: PQQ-like beta-propeller repeat protein, partial [Candidatus Sumerlaeia bacterium]|nr:PQQ-like beta-propeller repeat protein [Candidatus Sumerlaeia bacterium]